MNRFIFIFCFILINQVIIFGQEHFVQNVRGYVIDQDSENPIPGVTVLISNYASGIVTISDSSGYFKLKNVPVGRVNIQAMLIGYQFYELRNIELKTGKELILTIKMTESIEDIEEVVIKAHSKDQPINEMAVVSSRSFTVEETERYAGTWLDPARMVTNYAGVMAAGDQRNDIIIRGNSPLGLLWKLEGVNIPNPNHFGTLGTTGGPISILNNNLLDNSDFFTGAFPAEYGNAMSGVFDLRMRVGNNENYEHTIQIGMNGLEFQTEGPFSKKYKGSYLMNYRYSTLMIFDWLDIHFGVSGVPEFQDLSFKLNFPTEKAGKFNVFGVGGISSIEVFYDDKKEDDWSFGRDKLNFSFGSGMAVTGISHFYPINKSSYLKSVIAFTGTKSSAKADSATTERETIFYGDNSNEIKIVGSVKYTKKFNAKNSLNAGCNLDVYKVHYEDSVLLPDKTYLFLSEVNDEYMTLLGAFTQFKHRFTNDLSLIAGVYSQFFTINNSFSVEPRIGLKWKISKRQGLSLGFGIHSQLQPRLFYYQKTEIDDENYFTNKELNFSKSDQFIIAYDYLISNNLRLKLESYYQYLHDIPVEENPSSFSMINYGTSFFEARADSLINEGTGRNYGFELTLEKFLSKSWYLLLTSSVFESNYKGSDEIRRNTIYNGNYVMNFLSGYKFKLTKHSSLNLDVKTVYAGGKYYIPVDLEQSSLTGQKVLDYSQAYNEQFPDYFRLDSRIYFKMNRKKFNTEFAFDVQNLTKRKNVLLQTYDVETNSIVYDYQLGLFYVFFLRFQF